MKKRKKYTNEKICKKTNFTKLTHSGISLIVLVITIIVIIILAAAVILSISNNNPVKEASIARYESDCANMQAIFTNTVAKIMAKNKGVVQIKYGKINEIEEGQKEVVGKITYSVIDAENSKNSSGKIIFDSGNNTETVFYVGKKLPIYSAGNTKWYVDNKGMLALNVKEEKYGVGDIINIDDLVLINGSNFKDVIPENITEVVFTDEVVPSEYSFEKGNLLNMSENGSGQVVSWIDGDVLKVSSQKSNVNIIANSNCSNMFSGKINLDTIDFSNLDTSNISNTGSMFNGCTNLKNIDTSLLNITGIGSYMFYNCKLLTNANMPLVTSVGGCAFQGCTSLISVNMPELKSTGERAFQHVHLL